MAGDGLRCSGKGFWFVGEPKLGWSRRRKVHSGFGAAASSFSVKWGWKSVTVKPTGPFIALELAKERSREFIL